MSRRRTSFRRAGLRFGLLYALPGCAGDRVILHAGVLPGRADAVALGDDPSDLHRQRPSGQLERVDLPRGRVAETFDPQTDRTERLLDLDEDGSSARVLAASDDALFIWADGTAQEPLLSDPGAGGGVRHGALTQGGFVVVLSGVGLDAPECTARFVGTAAATLPLPAEACTASGALVADPLEAQAWLFTTAGSWVLTPASVAGFEAAGDVATFEPVTGSAVVATAGTSVLDAFDADGAPIWSEPVELVDHRVRALTALGTAGIVAVASGRGASGSVSLLYGTTGDGVVALATPAESHAISGSGDGQSLALAVADEVHLFDIQLGAAP